MILTEQEQFIYKSQLVRMVLHELSIRPERHQTAVLCRSMGKTLKKTGEAIGRSKERARQLDCVSRREIVRSVNKILRDDSPLEGLFT